MFGESEQKGVRRVTEERKKRGMMETRGRGKREGKDELEKGESQKEHLRAHV